jgi:uncharacterized protein YbgA (DUF1722 family)/uncharacterized protein YbbK (DUF523 family)
MINELKKLNQQEIKVGISACLLGENVRYNGGHTQSKFCMDSLSKYFNFRKYCPEVASGFGIPRPTLRLEGDINNPRLAYTKQPGSDVSKEFYKSINPFIEKQGDLSGYILMKKSPSCGMDRIKIYQDNGHPHQTFGRGLFADALMKKFPNLPVEEDGRLNDKHLRENFLMRVYAYHLFKKVVSEAEGLKSLIKFHSFYKYVLMAHNQKEYKRLGRLVSEGHKLPFNQVKEEYLESFMLAIKSPATRKNHTNVLQHIFGYLKQSLSSEAKQDILVLIEKYRTREVNLITPLTLISHYLKQYGSQYINQQVYLQPYPSALGLQNNI